MHAVISKSSEYFHNRIFAICYFDFVILKYVCTSKFKFTAIVGILAKISGLKKLVTETKLSATS